MPTYHMTFDLNSAQDVQEVCTRLRMIADTLMPPKKEEEKVEGLISQEELIKRIGKAPATIATWRGEGMPYVIGRPCQYPWEDTYAWIKKYKMLGKRS
jgi:hypothetical protein